MTAAKWQFWIDRGGTFTDVVGCDPTGALHSHKLLSVNPERYPDAAVQGIRDLLKVPDHAPLPAGLIGAVKMGTTVATNALLERAGTPTALVINTGFRDLLRIGYQNRPRLFDLHIDLPTPLYSDVIEVDARLDASGAEITPLDQTAARRDLQRLYQAGYRSLAIALIHAYLNPAQEQALADLAREIGFTHVSTSAESSPLIKLVARGDTAVVDAYLTPILRRYVDQVTGALQSGEDSAQQLYFMSSGGGLLRADLFQGKDAILSGPAGGVVGMITTARAAGFDRLIGFDMGGTSTDVCHYAGQYERSFETEVAGVRLRAPMMDIHTVAAGGGSILHWRDGRTQVGPESAGADPGPACYRRGGPLTVTDCNVMLGRIQPAHFPHVFGPNGDLPLDTSVVHQKFTALAAAIARDTGGPQMTPQAVAEGFLQVAIENMARAVKKISVERGYDVTDYTLVSFGGAGGQHACRVADALGIGRVLLHPMAGVLSALGIGLADIRVLRQVQVNADLDQGIAPTLLDQTGADARAEVVEQGVASDRITTQITAHLRHAGAHQTLPVAYGPADQMRAAFHAAHARQFGFTDPDRPVILDMVEVEAVGKIADHLPDARLQPTGTPPGQIDLHIAGAPQRAALRDRADLAPGEALPGPAILTDPTGTNLIEPGWTGQCDASGNLILTRTTPLPRQTAAGTQCDPILLEVFNNRFMSVAEQMGTTLAKTSQSVNIRERLDFSCALFDATGALVANAPHVPVHLGSMSQSVRAVIAEVGDRMRPGDVYMMNAPFDGGTHLPDVTVITPVYDREGHEVLFYTGARGHHADIGGMTPGSTPPFSTHIDDEGVVIPITQLVRDGQFCEAETRGLLASGRYPCRNIDQNIADLKAQVAANATGVAEINRMIDSFGQQTVLAYMRHVQGNAEASVRAAIGKLRSGQFTYSMDSGAKICVRITVDPQNQSATVDFTGTSPQQPGNYNAPLSVCQAAVLYVFRTLVGQDIPLNEGCLAPLKIIAPEGSMINARYPAAVIAGNTEVSQSITDCLFGALGVIAGSQGTVNNYTWGNAQFQNYETLAGGTGAGPGFDGASAVHSHMTNTRMTDPEVLESRFPVRVEEFSIRAGSGGAGRWSGGDGVRRRLRYLDDMTVTILSSHRVAGAFGGDGGQPGACGENRAIRADGTVEDLAGNDQIDVAPGDMVEICTPGGGGWGKAPD